MNSQTDGYARRCTRLNRKSLSMAKKTTHSLTRHFYHILLITILILAFQQCKSKKVDKSFILDNIKYELNDGGIGYDVKSDNSLDLNKTSFVAALHITNSSKELINLDSSSFKLTSETGTAFSLQTKMGGTDVSAMYKQEMKPGDETDYTLTFSVPKEGHYNLHIISPISKSEKVIHY